MFKISIIYQHTSFKPNSWSRRSLGLRPVGDTTLLRVYLSARLSALRTRYRSLTSICRSCQTPKTAFPVDFVHRPVIYVIRYWQYFTAASRGLCCCYTRGDWKCRTGINRPTYAIVLKFAFKAGERTLERVPPGRGVTYADRPHVTYKNVLVFNVFQIFVKIFVHNEIYW